MVVATDDNASAARGQKPHFVPKSGSRLYTRVFLYAIAGILIVALALGLGLGFGLKHDECPPTTSPLPSSTPSAVWKPAVGSSWQIILSQKVEIDSNNPIVRPDVDVFDIDLFVHQNSSVIASLHKLGKKVICYFSAGSYEPYRPDSSRFLKSDLGAQMDGWPDERWLNLRSTSVREVMVSRISLARDMGCDAIDPDNVDGYENDNGLDLTREDSIDFVAFLAGKAKEKKLAIGLKNANDIVTDVLDAVQFSVNEQCAEYSACESFAPFIEAGKPVFHIEYPSGAPEKIATADSKSACSAKGASRFSTVLKSENLDSWVEYCDGRTVKTDVVS
ncbi:glycoside hydrolase superfamily [Apodospora peruviana]|uniref:alpha-galactosidase n=1 Tax=Apodospora peruviana TaxID=516989 RepID=A0AAE0I1T1_9PEZI|nr:glycoside hydrolase superfamily [Apodospora peruviana]